MIRLAISAGVGLVLAALGGAGTARAQQPCAIRPSAGAPYYDAMVTGSARLTPTETIFHAANRLGFGHSSLGPHTPKAASDCTKVALAEDIATQIASLGKKPDSPELQVLRPRLMPLSMFSRRDINATLNRFAGVDPSAFGLLQWRAWQHIAMYVALREVTGSQSLSGSTVSDVQVNLDAVLSEFWFNHFNVSASKATQYISGTDGYHPTVRANIGGTFYALLRAVMRHPAMLVYLDNAANRYDSGTGTASNQNLARELLELHTLGQKPKQSPSDTSSLYGQGDVVELAKILAGWNAYPYTAAPVHDGFVYNDALDADLTVRFLGVDYPSTGVARVEAVLRWLANRAETKRHICGKLAGLFYGAALVAGARDGCIAAWGTDGNLKAMYGALLQRPDFWGRSNYRTLYRTPIELAIGVMRQLGMTAGALAWSALAEGRTGNEFPIASLSPQALLSRLDVLERSRTWQPLWLLLHKVEALLGAFRMDIAPPAGYAMDGAAYLSTAYIDRISRLGLEVSGLFDYLHASARNQDQTSNLTRFYGQLAINDIGGPLAFERYVASSLNMGGVVSGDAAARVPAPYVMPAQHGYIMLVTAGNPAYWGYWKDDPSDRRLEKGWPAMAISNANELKK